MAIEFAYDSSVDAMYIRLQDKPYAYGKDLDPERRVDFAADGTPVGVELLAVSRGVNIDDLPQHVAIGRLLEEHGMKVFA